MILIALATVFSARSIYVLAAAIVLHVRHCVSSFRSGEILKLTKWERRRNNEWESGTGGYGKLLIQKSSKAKRFYLLTSPFLGNGVVLSDHSSLKEAKDAGEAFAKKLQSKN